MSGFLPVPYSQEHARRMQFYLAMRSSPTSPWFSADADLHELQAREEDAAVVEKSPWALAPSVGSALDSAL